MIKNSIEKMASWYGENAPILLKQIEKPASNSILTKVKKEVAKTGLDLGVEGLQLPEAYLDWLGLMNGQKNDMDEKRVVGLIPRANEKSGHYFFYSHRMLLNDLSLNFDMITHKGKHKCSKELNDCYYDPAWIRIGSDWDSAIAIDMNPSKKGNVGQVIFIDYASADRHYLAKSFGEFLLKLAKGFEKGQFEFDGEYLNKPKPTYFPILYGLAN